MRVVTRTLLPLLLLAGCNDINIKVGVSFSDENGGAPDVDLPNPLGIIRGEYETERGNIGFCEHISSLPKVEEGSGLNHCGFMVPL